MPKNANPVAVACEPLTLTVTIPAPAVPLFKAVCSLHMAAVKSRKGFENRPARTMDQVASQALVRWITSEDSMEVIDSAVNKLIKEYC